jgi:hypothetical protein
LLARSPCLAAPSIRFLSIGSRFTLHASFPRSVALTQLRFASFAVTSLRRDLHPQECAHAGRTNKKAPAYAGALIAIGSLTMSYFHTGTRTIIGAESFHCPVRDGKEWDQLAMVIRLKRYLSRLGFEASLGSQFEESIQSAALLGAYILIACHRESLMFVSEIHRYNVWVFKQFRPHLL